MRALLVAAALATVPAQAFATEWNFVRSDDLGAGYWRPLGPSPENPEWVRIEERVDFTEVHVVDGFSGLSATSIYEVNCAGGEARDLEWTAYAGASLTGATKTFGGSRQWSAWEPHTNGEALMTAVCAYATPQGR